MKLGTVAINVLLLPSVIQSPMADLLVPSYPGLALWIEVSGDSQNRSALMPIAVTSS